MTKLHVVNAFFEFDSVELVLYICWPQLRNQNALLYH